MDGEEKVTFDSILNFKYFIHAVKYGGPLKSDCGSQIFRHLPVAPPKLGVVP